MKHRSISQRLDRAKSFESKKSILLDWSDAWEDETRQLIRNLEQAINTMDYDKLCINTGQLKAVAEKHFTALPRIFERLFKLENTSLDTAGKEQQQSELAKSKQIPDGTF